MFGLVLHTWPHSMQLYSFLLMVKSWSESPYRETRSLKVFDAVFIEAEQYHFSWFLDMCFLNASLVGHIRPHNGQLRQ